MPFEDEEFKFPDETQGKPAAKERPEIEIEIEDDTPAADRGRQPLPRPLVEELEKDELDQYDDNVKTKLKQMRKVWHDERREKEAAQREQQETLTFAQRVLQENQRIKNILTNGEKEYVTTVQHAAGMELEMAKRAYKEAYDAGDTDKIVDAQQAMQQANIRLMQAKNFRMPSLQEPENNVQPTQQQQQPTPPRPDNRANAWQERNQWYGQDEEMTASALGLHEKLKRNGVVVGSDDYYDTIDKTMRRRFPENFEEQQEQRQQSTRTRPSTVVAPATRSTSPNKVKLRQSQMDSIKKLGITPELYVKEFLKLEAQNG